MTVSFNLPAFALLAILLGATASQAQTLDSEYERLLSNDCAVLNPSPAGDLGPNLQAICDAIPDGAGSSAGGTSAASNAAGMTVATRREERLEDDSEEKNAAAIGGGFNLFGSVDHERLNRHRTTFEDGFQSNVWRGTVGTDFLLSDTLLVGGFFSYANNNGDYRSGGDFDTHSYSPTLFASVLPMPDVFVDVSLSYTRNEYDRDRRANFTDPGNMISGKSSSDTHGDQLGVTFAVGYDHVIENITVGPRAGLNYSYQNIDGYREKGSTGLELEVSDQYVNSLQSVLGLEATMAISTPLGVLIPRVGADYVHEFMNDQRDIRVNLVQDLRATPLRFSFENQKPDRDFFHVGAGLVLALPNGFQPFVNFRSLVGNSHFEQYVTSVGVRLEL